MIMNKRLVVRHHRPHYPIIIGIVLVVVVLVGGWFVFDFGLRQAGFEREILAQKESEWSQLKARLELEVVEQREQATRLELGYQVEREAFKLLQRDVARLHDDISNLKDELTFYRDIVAPENHKEGLSVRGFLISQLEDEGHYRYKIVITKVPNDGHLIRGSLTFEVEGKESGKEKRYNLKQLSLAKKPAQKISFRFKYFQNLGGDINLPKGFEPTKVTLTLNPKGKKLKKSVEQFDWLVEES